MNKKQLFFTFLIFPVTLNNYLIADEQKKTDKSLLYLDYVDTMQLEQLGRLSTKKPTLDDKLPEKFEELTLTLQSINKSTSIALTKEERAALVKKVNAGFLSQNPGYQKRQ